MERDKKKIIISTIIASVFLLVLIISATYAYFASGNIASGTTNLTTATEKIGTVTITNPTDNLYLKLSAYDMQESKVGTSYYATSTNGTGESIYSLEKENNVFANYTITGGEVGTKYKCTFKLNITAPSEIRNGDMLLELNLQNGATINGLSTFNKDLYGATGRYTVTFTQTGNGTGNLITGDIKLNNTSGNQSHIEGVTLGTSIQASELNCEIAEKVEEPPLASESICTYDETSTVAEGEYGAKYNCKVDPNKPEYTFYLIDNNEDGTSDLIMSHNINASGEEVIPNESPDLGTVAWYEDEFRTYNGPVTAMEYLHNATKSWTNVEPLNYEYYDREVQGIDLDNPTDNFGNREGYVSFTSTNGVAIITQGDIVETKITIGSINEPLRTRLPIHIRNNDSGEVQDQNEFNAFLYENIDYEDKPRGYWTMSSDSVDCPSLIVCDPDIVWCEVGNWIGADNKYEFGVRPVITVKL